MGSTPHGAWHFFIFLTPARLTLLWVPPLTPVVEMLLDDS